MRRSLPEQAIDNAFIAHLGKLFDHFCANLEIEAGTDPDELRNSKLPSARAKFERSFAFARATHSQMSDHLKQLKDDLI